MSGWGYDNHINVPPWWTSFFRKTEERRRRERCLGGSIRELIESSKKYVEEQRIKIAKEKATAKSLRLKRKRASLSLAKIKFVPSQRVSRVKSQYKKK